MDRPERRAGGGGPQEPRRDAPMTILCYHAVEPGWPSPLAVKPEAFAEQMAWLGLNRTTIDLATAVGLMDERGRLPGRRAAITLDDGFASVFDHARSEERRVGKEG